VKTATAAAVSIMRASCVIRSRLSWSPRPDITPECRKWHAICNERRMKKVSTFGTVVSALSGVAGLVCLLTGLQLWILGEEFGRILQQDPTAAASLLGQWQTQARMAAAMSIGAGALVFLLVARQINHHRWAGRPRDPQMDQEADSSPEIDTISVRVFEVDTLNRAHEVGVEPHPRLGFAKPLRLRKAPADLPSASEQSESIIRNIREIAGGRAEPAAKRTRWRDLATLIRRILPGR
jgi:hypothetical protein